jgi:hypothetical protein
MLPMGGSGMPPVPNINVKVTAGSPGTKGAGAQEGARGEPSGAEPKAKPKSGGNKPGFETVQGQSGIDHPTP